MILYRFIHDFVARFFAGILIRLFYNVEFIGKENLENLFGPLIIASNHKTLFDGFLIGLALPFRSKVFPMRYLIETTHFRGKHLERFRKLGLMTFFRNITGGISSHRGEGVERAIKEPTEILKKGGTILMFPEGRIVREDGLGKFFNGTSALAIASDAPVIPFHIKVENKKIFVTAGEAFTISGSIEAGTETIREKIEALR